MSGRKGHFGWKFKGTHKDLDAAYRQLKNYADALENPPLLIVCDLLRFRIRTNFTGTVVKLYEFTVSDLDNFDTRQLLAVAFRNPERLRPGITRAVVTQGTADKFTRLAEALRQRPNICCCFCMGQAAMAKVFSSTRWRPCWLIPRRTRRWKPSRPRVVSDTLPSTVPLRFPNPRPFIFHCTACDHRPPRRE